MSLGYGAIARLVMYDDETAIYEYGGYNFNEEEYYNEQRICDGIITIQRSCFPEPEIHEKLKRMPSGRKKLVKKKIIVDVDFTKYINDGLITIENCSNTWQTIGKTQVDRMAFLIVFELMRRHQEQEKLPERISIYM